MPNIAISFEEYSDILEKKERWDRFKAKRTLKKFDISQGEHFVTSIEREELLDHLFSILKKGYVQC